MRGGVMLQPVAFPVTRPCIPFAAFAAVFGQLSVHLVTDPVQLLTDVEQVFPSVLIRKHDTTCIGRREKGTPARISKKSWRWRGVRCEKREATAFELLK